MNEVLRDKLNQVLAFFKDQLRETSTLRGIVLLLGSAGLLAGYPAEAVMTVVTFAAGVLAILLPDKIK